MGAATAAKERPILFSGPMIQAIRAGRKTQTRRTVKPQPPEGHGVTSCHYSGTGWAWERADGACTCKPARCPYEPGMRLWVRETFSLVPCSAGCEKYPEGFDPTRSSASQPHAPHEGVRYRATWDRSHSARWRPSIHMPRWASRILLEVAEVRVERLQDISEADAYAEGIPEWKSADQTFSPIVRFRRLWESINGPGSWGRNDWLWVIGFRVLEGLA